jgi:mannose-6-phosphate isomerase-like protein (cupin superfamily)
MLLATRLFSVGLRSLSERCRYARTTMSHTIKNLRDVKDVAPNAGIDDRLEARFCFKDLEAADTGLAYQRIKPGQRALAHRHENAEEIYVVIAGSGRVKLGDEVHDIAHLDAIRVAPTVVRAFEAGPNGLDLLAFGPRHEGDGEIIRMDVWGGD